MHLIKSTVFICLFLVCSSSSIAEEITQTKVFSENNLEVEAKRTGLTIADLKLFNEIMESPSAFFYNRGEKNIYYILAAESNSESERMRFARLWYEAEEKYNEGLGNALRAYTQAAIEKNGRNPKIFDMDAYDKIDIDDVFSSKGGIAKRVKLYIKTKGCDECVDSFNSLKNRIEDSSLAGVDIFFVDVKTNQQQIITWAKNQLIPPELVKSKKITLNFDDGKAAKDIPYVQDYVLFN
jgi:integrating conjugative element protein (TIGR03759 family)